MIIADDIAGWLHEKEIDTVFAIIGGGNVALWDAIHRAHHAQIVACHHEQAAAMASTAFNRIRQSCSSLCLVTTGGGSTNALTGVMAAYMDSIPLLVISGNEASNTLTKPQRVKGVQGYDSEELARPCTVLSTGCTAENYNYTLQRVWGRLREHRLGPVWLNVPKDVQTHAA